MATQAGSIQPAAPLEPERPPQRRQSPREWAQENLFSSWFNTILTIAFGALLGWLIYVFARFVFVNADWLIIEVNLTNLLVFDFPRDELWRVWLATYILAATFALAIGAAVNLREAEIAEGRMRRIATKPAWRRAFPVILLIAVLLWLAGTVQAVLLTAGVIAVVLVARLLGKRIPARHARWAFAAAAGGLVAALLVIAAFGGVPPTDWGGLLLTIFLAVAGIVISFPLGVLLALGRRSSLPAVRAVCVAYIELIRGVPLITLLFMGAFIIGFFLPPGTDAPSITARGVIALVIFTAAYVAEIVRGGLQSIPKGQPEAAAALGLSSWKTTRLIVLPQALRAVIPALVGQFISLFKDTSLVFIIGLIDLLAVAEAITAQPDFIAQGLIFETLVFVAFIYWVGSYTMSRESQLLERRLGIGER